MKLSTRVRYGCRAMVDLALRQEDGPVSLDVLADDTAIPGKYLAKILQDLRRGGIVRSVRGAHGGYLLNGAPDKITVLDVLEALEGKVTPVDCLDESADCPIVSTCVTREVWEELREAMENVLRSTTLASLMARHKRKTARKVGRHARR